MSESLFWLFFDTWRAKRQGRAGIEKRQRARLAKIVSFARTNSPYFSELYKDLPDRVEDTTPLPITNKKNMMARFDDWCTDRSVTIEKAHEFVKNQNLIGEKFMGKYTIATTSGTTGTPGIFLLDDRNMAVTSAVAFRMLSSWLGIGDVIEIIAARGRLAMVMATGGHFASAIAAARFKKKQAKTFLALSAHRPIPELVERLNRFRPVLLAPYASMGALLATEQEAGRLRIEPALIALSAEGLAASEYDRIATTFDAKVGNSYAATECPFLSYSCDEGWLHVNADWVIVEPVDADYEPVPKGEQSHTVLVTNLANQVQPILRYDLGDSVLLRPDPCLCGNPLPAIQVKGRASDLLSFESGEGERVTIVPLAFSILMDRVPGINRTQIVQTSPTGLRVRLLYEPGVYEDTVWSEVHATITGLLAERGLDHVTVERGQGPPEQGTGGKFREVIPLSRGDILKPPTGDNSNG